MRWAPGCIIDIADHALYYDKSFVASFKTDTPFVRAAERQVRYRQFFHYAEPTPVYEGHIHTPTEKLLTWQPTAVLICVAALILTIAVWVIR